MKKKLASPLSVAFLHVLSIVLYHDITGIPPSFENVVQRRLTSRILGQERDVIIHLPKNLDLSKTYPVVYVLDGTSQDGHIAEKFDSLSAAGLVPPVIIVGIPNMNAENRRRQLIPPYMRTDTDKADSPFGDADKFLEFMESELFPFIEDSYPATMVRLFAGNSRAGLLVMHSLIYKSEMFQARFCFSTPFWRWENLMVLKISDFLKMRDTMKTFLYMSAGEKETPNIKNGLTAMAKAMNEKSPLGLTWHAEFTPDADHQSNAQVSSWNGIARWGEYLKR
ncbi:MAG: alpha/beta hydrolase [Ignavibacteriales bacterium]|nr:alpha/beta hydrolase [Ignavibacteriales bacterium]